MIQNIKIKDEKKNKIEIEWRLKLRLMQSIMHYLYV